MAEPTRILLGLLLCSVLALPATATAAPPSPAPDPAAPVQPQSSPRPNILVWMMDDVGFAQLSCFGGLVQTPNIDRVARMGLRYSNYHTAAICSASRASFLTGRMPHSVHIGGHSVLARPYPGYDAQLPASAGTIAENLRQAGYTTFALGKWDHAPQAEITPAGPFTHWPTGQGFDRFYGFLSADTDNWAPALVRDLSPIPTPPDPGYHLSRDLADQAIAMIQARSSVDMARPFFMYWATGAAHAPHHAPQAWIDRYRGKFDMGWDKARDSVLASQKAQRLVPKSTRLAPRPDIMPAWDSLSPDQKRLYARQMEVFAASLSFADEQFGRILDALQARGELDNTMVIIISDNGASAEGGLNGLYNEGLFAANAMPSLDDNLRFLNDWGGPKTYPHYGVGWASAGNTPFRYYKQTTYEGGIHVPMVIAWTNGIKVRGELRSQFVHVADLAPTIMEASGVMAAATVNNVPQSPMDGLSFGYTFAAPQAADRHQAQYFEMFGNKSLWSQGWSIVTNAHNTAWDVTSSGRPDAPWELYDLTTDPGQTRNLAATNATRVAELERSFDAQARRYNVYPIGNFGEAFAEMARRSREDFARRGGKWRYPGPISNVNIATAPPIFYRSYSMKATLDLPSARITGPIFAFGGEYGGMGLYLLEGRPTLFLNTIGADSMSLTSDEALPAGTSSIELDFTAPSTTLLQPSDYQVTIRSGERILAQQTLHLRMKATPSATETFGIGIDTGSPVMPGGHADTPLNGQIRDVTFDFNAPATQAARE